MVVVFAALVVISGRSALEDEVLPAFSVPSPPKLWVELGEGFSQPGVHQFSDGLVIGDVIKLTGVSENCLTVDEQLSGRSLVSGERFDLVCHDEKVTHLQRSWMTAWQRISLGVSLHPDRMTLTDWMALPGIGERLAERVENDRQNNGEFGSLGALTRVRGIGVRRIEAWRDFFEES
jgi:competence protein ComEA